MQEGAKLLSDFWFGSIQDHISSIASQIQHALAGDQYIISDSGIAKVTGPTSDGHGAGHGAHPTSPPPPPPPPPYSPPSPPPPPAGTVVGTAGGFQIDLIWDASVSNAPAGFKTAVTAAAQFLTSLFTNHEIINIDVGYGEVNGSAMSSGDLGQSQSYGYLSNYATVAAALAHDNYPVVAAANAPTGAQFFLTSAEAKTYGIISATSSGVDGFIGLSASYPMDYSASGPAAGSGNYSAVGVAEHELTEVLGRIGLEGRTVNGAATYTPIDLFNYASGGHLELSGNGGYFSVNGGTTALGTYNNSSNGGDVSDWGGAPVGNDAFSAFMGSGPTPVSSSDVQELATIGYKLSTGGLALA